MCTIAAPASAASMAAFAMSSGLTAQYGLFVTFVSSPVIAQVIITSWFMGGSLAAPFSSYYRVHNIYATAVRAGPDAAARAILGYCRGGVRR